MNTIYHGLLIRLDKGNAKRANKTIRSVAVWTCELSDGDEQDWLHSQFYFCDNKIEVNAYVKRLICRPKF